MRRMSFAATVDAMRAGSKTVTRRDPGTWAGLRPCDRVTAVEQAQGLPAGARQEVIGVIEITSNRVEPLARAADPGEAQAEGFTSLAEFRDAWERLHRRWDPAALVRRIEFAHVDEKSA